MSAPSTPPPALSEGHLIASRYRVLRLLGQGGMGAVYEAEHVELGRRVAIKTLLPSVAADREIVARFFREARAAASIGHPGIVEVFDLGQDGESAFLVMEKLEGEELAEYLRRVRPSDFREVARIGAELCDAIAAAHEHGIIHRDLKPQNVFLAKRARGKPQVKVLDFGIAKLTGPEEIGGPPLTETGRVFGTPLYMAPEQLRNTAGVDARADVYALGVVLYEVLAGVPPFAAANYPELVLAICSGTPTPLREVRADVPPALERAVARAMALRPEDRFATARALGDALEAFLRTGADVLGGAATMPSLPPAPHPRPASRSRNVRWVLAALATVAALAGIGWSLDGSTTTSSVPAITGAPAGPPPRATPDAGPSAQVEPPIVPGSPGPAPADLRVVVVPVGAQVLSSEGARCLAPCTLTGVEAPVTLTVSHAGYVTQVVSVDPALEGETEIRLVRLPRASSVHDDDPPPLHAP